MANITKPLGLSNIWASGGTKIDPGAPKVQIGWVVQLPPYEYQNWLDNRQDQALAHISQHGIPEWDAQTEYQGLLSYTQGSNGMIYKCIQTNTNKDPSNTLNTQYWSIAFETYGSVAAVQAQLTAHITNYQTLSGIGNLAAARANLSVYSKAESDTRFASLNGNAAQVFSVGIATRPEHAVRLSQVGGLLTQATESVAGVVSIATNAEVEAGAIDTKVVTPKKGAVVYLKKSGNLAGLANVATARVNLGLGSAAVMNREQFMEPYKNLTDLTDPATARNALQLTSTATRTEDYFVRTGLNLGDIPDKPSARNNLGLGSAATLNINNFLQPGYSLSDVTSVPAARANLGLGSAATYNIDNFLQPGYNLGDVPNKQAGRNNLGLGSAATRNVVGANGDLDYTASVDQAVKWYRLPNGIIHQFGVATISNNTRVGWAVPMNVGDIQITIAGAAGNPSNLFYRTVGIDRTDNSGFNATAVYGTTLATITIYWHATGWL